ncbi:unnamed protein product [Lactuca virosa]|uniref:Formin-like protein 18 n=1 Tax=Lactuca virosa TaxID=75947 RepID=A0AAU9PXA4_9ASTR|nr:unnamed protein product [Lactuca virosa]
MDPCPFVRLTVGNLALKIPVASKAARSVIHPSSSPCFCKIKLKNFPVYTAVVPFLPPESQNVEVQTLAATFHMSKSDLDRLVAKSLFAGKLSLKISIFTGRRGSSCGLSSGKLLAEVTVPLNLAGTESKACVFHNGWVTVGKDANKSSSSAQFHLNVKAEPDPRFVFQFDGEPVCSPQVFQIQGNIRQPVFTCKFSFRSTTAGDRNQRSRSLPPDISGSRKWLSSFGSDRERPGKERKGWSVTVHDLSGSPVAAASMVTPFVASPGSDRVSRSNPGCWLILRPGDGTWKPWGRLEAWRERGAHDGLGYRFELIPDSAAAGIVLAESTLSLNKGGRFMIDLGAGAGNGGSGRKSNMASPVCSPRGSGDFGYGLWPYCAYKGFVMAATVEGEGKRGKAMMVEVSVQHVNCTEDAAAFVALSAAIDLSIDACRLFSQKLRKELCQPQEL